MLIIGYHRNGVRLPDDDIERWVDKKLATYVKRYSSTGKDMELYLSNLIAFSFLVLRLMEDKAIPPSDIRYMHEGELYELSENYTLPEELSASFEDNFVFTIMDRLDTYE